MSRAELVNEIFDRLEKEHVNLYHSISKREFQKHKKEFLKNVDTLDELHFDAGILKLFALFKDAHTSYRYAFDHVDADDLFFVERKLFVKSGKKLEQVVKINEHDINQVVEKLKEVVPFEVDEWFFTKVFDLLKSLKALAMVDMGSGDNQIFYTTESGKVHVKTCLSNDVKLESGKNTVKDVCVPYQFRLKNSILEVRYPSCQSCPQYPFNKFCQDIEKVCEKKMPRACLVDLRDNVGGDSEVIHPLIEFLFENRIRTYVLMNERVFSSGTFALADLKYFCNAKFLGTNAGQPTRRYGWTGRDAVENKRFSYSTHYFDFCTLPDKHCKIKSDTIKAFDYEGVIRADVYIPKTIDDIKMGKDLQKKKALKYIEKEMKKECELE